MDSVSPQKLEYTIFKVLLLVTLRIVNIIMFISRGFRSFLFDRMKCSDTRYGEHTQLLWTAYCNFESSLTHAGSLEN